MKYIKDNLITKDFYKKFIDTIQQQLNERKEKSFKSQKQNIKRIKEIDRQIEKLMSLFSRRKIKAETIEKSIEPLQKEKDDIQNRIEDSEQINQILEIKVEEFSSESIRNQLERFEEMLDENNIHEMRSLVRDFIHKIDLYPKDNPGAKKWKRRIRIESYVRALTMTMVASRRGFEPLLPA